MSDKECHCCGNGVFSKAMLDWWKQFAKGASGGTRKYVMGYAKACTPVGAAKYGISEIWSRIDGTDSQIDDLVDEVDEAFDEQFGEGYYWAEVDGEPMCPFCNPEKEPSHDTISCSNA